MIIAAIVAFAGIVIASWCLGALHILNRQEEKVTARVIRPANITIEKHIHISEYTVSDPDVLDIDFPNSRRTL